VRFLLLSLENLAGDIAGLMGLGPVELRLNLGFMPSRGTAAAAPLKDVGAHTLGFIRLNRARMGFLLGNSNGRESIQDFLALDFQLSG
jgi:hypothetical protein